MVLACIKFCCLQSFEGELHCSTLSTARRKVATLCHGLHPRTSWELHMFTTPALRPLQQTVPLRPGLLLQKAKQPTALATAINSPNSIHIKSRIPSTAHRIHTGINISSSSSSSGVNLNLAAMATPPMMPSMGMEPNTHTHSSSNSSSMVRQGSNLEP